MYLTETTESTERNIRYFLSCSVNKIKSLYSSLFSVSSVSSVRNYSGFTILEVLVAMAVMVVVVVMVANLFRDASGAWDIGTQRAEMNTSARAGVEYIARELSCAVAGSIPDSAGTVRTFKKFKIGMDEDDVPNTLSFVALSGAEGKAPLRGIRIKYEPYQIWYSRDTEPFDPYSLDNWTGYPAPAPLITNVWRFEVTVCSNESDMLNGGVGSAYDSSQNSNMLPACVDICVEILSERDMVRALSFSDGSAEQLGFVMTNSRVYTTRVCFPNRKAR